MHACTDQIDAVVCSGACLFWSRGMKKPPEFGGFLARTNKRRRHCSDRLPSVPSASLPDKKDKDHDQSSGDQHPVLAVNTKKCKTLNEKLHRSRPQILGRISGLFVQDKRFGNVNLLFLYFWRADPRSMVRKKISNRPPRTGRSGNLPAPAFQPDAPRDATGNHLPTA